MASDDKFLSSNDLQTWLKDCHQRIESVSEKINSAVQEKEDAENKRKVNSLVNDCTNALEHRTYEKYLESNKSCNDRLEDMNDESFVKEIRDKLDSLQNKYVEEFAKREIDNAIRKVDGLMKRANDQFDHFNDAAALSSFEESQSSAAELNNRADFANVQIVKDFFDKYAKNATEFKAKYNERTKKKEIDNAFREYNSLYNAAKRALDQNSFEICIEKCSSCSDQLQTLCDVDGQEHKEEHDAISKLKSQVLEVSKKREINLAQSSISRQIASAGNFLERYNPGASLNAYEKANDEFNNFKEEFGDVESVKDFITDMDQKMKSFSSNYAEQVTAREIENDIRSTKSKLNSAKDFLEKGVDEKALACLNEVIGEMSALESGMGASLATVQELSSVVKSTRVEFANKLLMKDVNKILQKGKSVLSSLTTTEERALPMNEETFSDLCGVVEEINGNPLFMDVESVKTFVESAEVFAKKAGKSLEGSSSSSSAAGGKESYKAILLNLLQGTIWIKKLKIIPKIVMDTTINPSFYKDYTTINNGTEGINKYIRSMIRNVNSANLDKLESPLVYSADERSRIESIIKSQISKAQANIKKDPKGKEDPTLTKWEVNYNDFGVNLGELTKHWTKCNTGIRYLMAMENGMNGLENRWATFMGDDFQKRENSYGQMQDNMRQTLGPNAPQIPFTITRNELQDHEAFLTLHDEYIPAFQRRIESWEKEMGGELVPKSVKDRLAELSDLCLYEHPKHCMMKATRTYNYKAERYIGALRNFPVARKHLLGSLQELHKIEFMRRQYEASPPSFDEKELTAKASKQYKEKEIIRPEWISPDNTMERESSRNGERDDIIWGDFREKYSGKIVFSKKEIERSTVDDSEFQTEFDYSDNVCGRAFWPYVLNSLPLGKDADGKPVYGFETLSQDWYWNDPPTFTLEMMLDYYIDGKLIERKGHDSTTYSSQRGNASEKRSDHWRFSQTMKLWCLSHPCHDPYDEWCLNSQRVMHHLVLSGAGKKTVKVELSYRVIPNAQAVAMQMNPDRITPKSKPIATGEFTVNMPNGAVKPMLIPKPRGDAVEKAMMEFYNNSGGWGKRADKTEHPIAVASRGEFYVAGYKNWPVGSTEIQHLGLTVKNTMYVKLPHEHGMTCHSMFYRSPMTGWQYEGVALFTRCALSIPGPKKEPKIPPLDGETGMSRMKWIDVDLLSEEELAMFKRTCPEDKRRTIW